MTQNVDERACEPVADPSTAERESSRILDAIDSMSDGFALYDANGQLLTCNARYRQMHPFTGDLIAAGARFETLLRAGLECSGANFERPDDEQVAARLAQHRLADGAPTLQQLAGSWVMMSERRTPAGDVVVVKTDVTELIRSSKPADEFLATVSHELRAPIISIRSALSLLSADAEISPGSVAKLIDLAVRNCNRVARIVDELLDLARIDSGSFKLNLQLTELQPILEQTLQGKGTVANIPNLHLEITDRAKGIRLVADPIRIQQVVDNLLLNAAIFSDGHAQIDLVADCHDDVVRVSVIDHGYGIPKPFQDRIFKILAQAPLISIRQQDATWLRLTVAKAIVEAHHGKIGVSSVEGQGATFYFDLPLTLAPGLQPELH